MDPGGLDDSGLLSLVESGASDEAPSLDSEVDDLAFVLEEIQREALAARRGDEDHSYEDEEDEDEDDSDDGDWGVPEGDDIGPRVTGPPWVCNTAPCVDAYFASRPSLRRHVRREHSGKAPRQRAHVSTYDCTEVDCPGPVAHSTLQALAYHRRLIHPTVRWCHKDGQRFGTVDAFVRHWAAVHGHIRGDDKNKPERLFCDAPGCTSTAFTMSALVRHRRLAHLGDFWWCPECPGRPPDASEAACQAHLQQAHPERAPVLLHVVGPPAAAYRCVVTGCGKAFHTRLTLHQHMHVVHPPRTDHACVEEGCADVSFPTADELEEHLKESHVPAAMSRYILAKRGERRRDPIILS